VPVAQVRASVEVSDSAGGRAWIEAPGIGLAMALDELPPTDPLATAVRNTFQAIGLPPSKRPLAIRIDSTIPVASGLGSGAAVTVALARALSLHLGSPLSDEEISRITFEVEKLHHGTPSGIDNTVITYARPVYFVKGRPIETISVGAALTLVIGDTGVAAPTREAVADVRRLWETDRARWDRVFDLVGEISAQARGAIEAGDGAQMGRLMDSNHALLQQMTVSSTELDRLVAAARSAGAAGAKMSGGGRGGNMIALISPEHAAEVASALRAAGAVRTIVAQVAN
jgi:mevalonate kinase